MEYWQLSCKIGLERVGLEWEFARYIIVTEQHEDESTFMNRYEPVYHYRVLTSDDSSQPALCWDSRVCSILLLALVSILFTVLRLVIVSPIGWWSVWHLVRGTACRKGTRSLAQRLKIFSGLWKWWLWRYDVVGGVVARHGVPAGSGVEWAHLGLVGEAGRGHRGQLLQTGLTRCSWIQTCGVGGRVTTPRCHWSVSTGAGVRWQLARVGAVLTWHRRALAWCGHDAVHTEAVTGARLLPRPHACQVVQVGFHWHCHAVAMRQTLLLAHTIVTTTHQHAAVLPGTEVVSSLAHGHQSPGRQLSIRHGGQGQATTRVMRTVARLNLQLGRGEGGAVWLELTFLAASCHGSCVRTLLGGGVRTGWVRPQGSPWWQLPSLPRLPSPSSVMMPLAQSLLFLHN